MKETTVKVKVKRKKDQLRYQLCKIYTIIIGCLVVVLVVISVCL